LKNVDVKKLMFPSLRPLYIYTGLVICSSKPDAFSYRYSWLPTSPLGKEVEKKYRGQMFYELEQGTHGSFFRMLDTETHNVQY
jgi:hypothetical protein